MKTLFFKNGMPITTAVLAITAAFATTSMQNSSNAYASKVGYILNAEGDCDISVACTASLTLQICRISYPNGEPAYERLLFQGNCVGILSRPD